MSTAGLERYRPSGRVGARFMASLPIGALAAAGCGAGYQLALAANPLVLLSPLLVLVCGVAVGACGVLVLRLGRVRSARAVWASSWLLAAVGLAAAWAIALWVAPGPRPPSGHALLAIGWLLEGCVVVPVAVAVPWRWWSKAVFCENEERFVPRRRLGLSYGPTPFAMREAAEESGPDGVLADLRGFAENGNEGEFRFWLHETSTAPYVTVFWRGQLTGLRGQRIDRDVLVLRRVRVDGSWIERLKQVCA